MINVKLIESEASKTTKTAPEHRIIQIIEGKGQIKTARSSYDLFPGLIVIIPPKLEYTLSFSAESRLISMEGNFSRLYFLKEVYCLLDNLYKEGQMLAEAMLRHSRENKDYTVTLFDAYLKYISLNVTAFDSFNSIIHSLTTKIENSYSDPYFDLMQLISSQGYATDYVRAKFLKITGMTPVEYLMNVRINNAKTMLEIFDDACIQEIASRCGYFDSAYFTRCFKKIVGMSPREYRQKH